MTNSVNASYLFPGNKPRWSRADAVAASIGGTSSVTDVITINHRLGRSPTNVTVTLRSITSAISGPPAIIVAGWNASVVNIEVRALVNVGGTSNIQFDVVSVIQNTIVT